MIIENLQELAKSFPDNWVTWGKKGVAPTKKPWNPATGQAAKANDPSTWVDFETAVQAVQSGNYTGIGFEFTKEAGIVGVDFDHCINPDTGDIDEWVLDWAQKFDSYTEISQSGTGIHILVRGAIPEAIKTPKAEMYDNRRYFALTGDTEEPRPVKPAQDVIDALFSELRSKRAPQESPAPTVDAVAEKKENRCAALSDSEVLEKARNGRHGALFSALYDRGEVNSYQDGDHSAADQRVCNALAFYTKCNKEQMDRLFRQSALMRDGRAPGQKDWDGEHDPENHRTYGQMTIDEAVKTCYSLYTGAKAGHKESSRSDIHREEESAPESLFNPYQPFEDDDREKLPDFPVDVLPKVIRDYALAGAQMLQTPVEMVALPCLCTVAACLQNKFVVEVKKGWKEPLPLWVLAIAPPSERKSPAIKSAMQPAIELEREINDSLAPEIQQNTFDRGTLEKRKSKLESIISNQSIYETGSEEKKELSEVNQKILELERNAKHPLRLFADDITPEQVAGIMTNQHECISIFSAEAGIFDTINGKYSNTPNTDIFTKSFSNDFATVDRVGREPIRLYNPALTFCLLVQPEISRNIVKNSRFMGVGFIARFLVCRPNVLIEREYDTPDIPNEYRLAYKETLHWAITQEYPNKNSSPKIIRLSRSAFKTAADPFFKKLDAKSRTENGELSEEGINGFVGKLQGITARIAALFHCLENYAEATEREISEETFSRAQRLVEKYFIPHAIDFYAADVFGHKLETDAKILFTNYILKQTQSGKEITVREIHQKSRKNLRFYNKEDFDKSIKELVERGYIRKELVKGKGRPSERIIVNPEALADTRRKEDEEMKTRPP